MLKLIITGAAGRMGRRFVANIAERKEDMKLVGATEWSGCEFLNMDAGSVAGVGALGVKLLPDMNDSIKQADVVIDFATSGVLERAKLAAENGVAIVIGTTALTADDRKELETLAKNGAKIVLSSNYSIGVNLLFILTKIAVNVLPEDFDIEVMEAHHNKKKDAPSGTAVSLAEILCQGRELSYEKDVRHGRNGLVGARTKREIGMHSIRGGDIVGDHTVMFAADGERVELTHKASSRDTFVRGALKAAGYIVNQPAGRIYSMQDVLAELLNK